MIYHGGSIEPLNLIRRLNERIELNPNYNNKAMQFEEYGDLLMAFECL